MSARLCISSTCHQKQAVTQSPKIVRNTRQERVILLSHFPPLTSPANPGCSPEFHEDHNIQSLAIESCFFAKGGGQQDGCPFELPPGSWVTSLQVYRCPPGNLECWEGGCFSGPGRITWAASPMSTSCLKPALTPALPGQLQMASPCSYPRLQLSWLGVGRHRRACKQRGFTGSDSRN